MAQSNIRSRKGQLARDPFSSVYTFLSRPAILLDASVSWQACELLGDPVPGRPQYEQTLDPPYEIDPNSANLPIDKCSSFEQLSR